ncbi:Rqc2 family fibronectin-binding protein [Peptoniphilus catoniae]|uniref:Rqc2 family fibronectin-binding protein n=1 Tax=Peptoniphilus catoniae TaxID=1660341 RepID=UPI0010FD1D9E|nr:NFACT RNA binding domain-containing protein [Peptoniphilus catoniae]
MAYDGSVLRAVIFDLKEKLIGSRIEKIYQISDYDLVINVRKGSEKYKLFISASNNAPRVYLTEKSFTNPQNPPAFCMLLRKHLEGFRIENIEQYKMDRIFKIDVSSKNDLSDFLMKSLCIEIMGKHSNIILIETESKKIYDSIKRVPHSMSRVRQILPALTYALEPISTALDPLSKDSFNRGLKVFNPNKSIRNNLISTFTGFSKLSASEICYGAFIDEDRSFSSLTKKDIESLEHSFNLMVKLFKDNNFSPIIIYKEEEVFDFFSLNLQMIKNGDKKTFSNICRMLEYFYSTRENNQIIKDKGFSIRKIIKNNIEKEKRKLAKQSDELNEALDRDIYKVYGDLISSNFFKINSGSGKVRLENFYDNMKEIEIPLDKKLSAHENAARYYKKFSKLKNAETKLKSEIKKTKSAIEYLENQALNMDLSENENDIEEIKQELFEMGYIKRYQKFKNKKPKLKTLEYTLSNGDKIYCGKNNKQNEYLTFKLANREDLWFHVKDAAGSHVILKSDKDEFSKESIEKAAYLAALHSSFKDSNNIAVDYCKKKFVKRHPSKIPGLVIYTDFNTLNVKKKDIKLDEF